MPSPRKLRPVPFGVDKDDPSRILLGPEVEFHTKMTWPAFKRAHPDLVVRLSERLHGVTLGNVRKVTQGRAR
jgi:hypothetical protein